MTFENLKIKNIDFTVRFKSNLKEFVSVNKSSHIIGLKLSGSAEHEFSDKVFCMNAGDIYFINQSEDYKVRELEPGVAFSVHFTTYEPIETESFCIPSGNPDEFIRQLVRIEKSAASRNDENRLMSEFYAFCSATVRLIKKNYSPKHRRMDEIKEYINLNFRNKNCLEGATAMCGLTRRRFNDVFKSSFGITPNRYIINLKINLASGLLENEYISISEVSDMCGFSDQYYFARVFKQETGISPGKYKKRV